MTPKRTSKDMYYLGIAREVATRSTCFRRAIGAIIVRDDQIISTGYVGAPRKTKDSLEHGFCLRDKLGIPHGQRYELCRSVHAEQNAIINAARAGVSLLGGDMYIFGSAPGADKPIDAFPCFICKKMIINSGLNRVVASTEDGGSRVFRIEDWIRDWQERDILDDEHQYGKKS
jgi:dCMP deaminase